MVLSLWWFCSLRDIGQWLDISGVVKVSGGFNSRGWRSERASTIAQGSPPTTKDYLFLHANSASVNKLSSGKKKYVFLAVWKAREKTSMPRGKKVLSIFIAVWSFRNPCNTWKGINIQWYLLESSKWSIKNPIWSEIWKRSRPYRFFFNLYLNDTMKKLF